MPLWMAFSGRRTGTSWSSAEARRYLVDERGLHPQVLVDSMIGVVPADLDVAQLFAPLCEVAERELAEVLAQPRKPGRPTKKEQEAIDMAAYQVERLKERTAQVAAFEEHAGKLAFFYTDAAHRVVRVRVQAVGWR